MRARSYLYVPGNSPDKLARADDRGADALIFDLEDAVPLSEKDAARSHVRAALEAGPGVAERWVRVNADDLADDLAAVVTAGLTGIVLPKASPDLLAEADSLLGAAGDVAVIALIESAAGVLDARQIAAGPRVVRLGIGEADLIGELGLRPGDDRTELLPVRLQVVLASAAAGIAPPIAPVETRLGADVDLAASTRALLAAGFRARTAVHPRQVATINTVFTPTAAETEAARRTVAALGGHGVAVDESGRMLDAAVVRSAHEVLARAGKAGTDA